MNSLRITFSGTKKDKEKKERNEEKLEKSLKEFKAVTVQLKKRLDATKHHKEVLEEPFQQVRFVLIYILYIIKCPLLHP
jgi:hypothetical protein